MSASLLVNAAALRLDARQRDMLAYMGLPMQGWPIAPIAPTGAQAPAAGQGLVVDTMNPAVRSLRLADLKKTDTAASLSLEKVSMKTPNSGANIAWAASEKIVNISEEQATAASTAVAAAADTLQLWSLDGVQQVAMPALGQKLLLLLECSTEQTGFPLAADALLLLRHILAALQCQPDGVVLCALPQQGIQPAPWLAQIAVWQPALVLVLGRNASRAVLGAQLQSGSLSALRGQLFDIAGVATKVSYPLDYLLRKPQAKAGAWQDWLAVKWQWDALITVQNEKRLNG